MAVVAALLALLGCAKKERYSVADLAKEVGSETRARAQIKVSIHLAEDQPTAADDAMLRDLEQSVERQNIGRLVTSGSEPGFVFITVEVENTAAAIEKLRAMLLKAGLLKRASFKVAAGS